MRSRRASAEHQAAISRRLELLSAELAGVRPSTAPDPGADEPDTWDTWGEPAADGTPWWDEHTRVAAPRRSRGPAGSRTLVVVPDEPDDPGPDPGWGARAAEPERWRADPPAPVPVPGRHAARRRVGFVDALWPEALQGRVRLAPAQLALAAVVVAVALAITAWWVVRSDGGSVADVRAGPATGLVTLPSETPDPGQGGTASLGAVPGASSGARPATVTVDVAGKVRRPGIAVLRSGARVVDALRAAGGARPGIDLTGLNLARVLVDGEQIVVGVPPPAGAAATALSSPGAAPSAPTQLVNLNTADETQLDALPEVGPVTAQAILGWRTEHGGFTSVDELLEVNGIGDATLARLAPYVTV